MIKIKCGIVGFGFYFPDTIRTAKDIAEASSIPEDVIRTKFGINQVYYPGANQQTSWMAVEAAKDCLKNTGIAAAELDLVIYFGENYGDYPNWSFGPKVQGEIGAVNAWCYDMECKCGSVIVALDQARRYILTDPSINTVMVVGGYRNVDRVDYQDKSVSFLYDVSCGGAAAIVKRDHNRRLLLEGANLADGSFAEAVVIPGGGTRNPITTQNVDDKYYRYFRLTDPEAFRDRLGAVTFKNLIRVVNMALEKSGLSQEDLNFLCVIHMKPSAHRQVLNDLGLTEENSIYLADYGHVGQLDPLISLNLATERGLVKEGDIVALLGMGLGYVWNCGIVQW